MVIDEIGKMEMKSRKFHGSIAKVLSNDNTTKPIFIATVPLKTGQGLNYVDNLKKREDAVLFTVTRQNRDSLADQIVDQVLTCL